MAKTKNGSRVKKILKIVVAVVVAFFWNYHLQRLFVYRNRNIKGFLKQHLVNNKEKI